jgi:hypothetical protein
MSCSNSMRSKRMSPGSGTALHLATHSAVELASCASLRKDHQPAVEVCAVLHILAFFVIRREFMYYNESDAKLLYIEKVLGLTSRDEFLDRRLGKANRDDFSVGGYVREASHIGTHVPWRARIRALFLLEFIVFGITAIAEIWRRADSDQGKWCSPGAVVPRGNTLSRPVAPGFSLPTGSRQVSLYGGRGRRVGVFGGVGDLRCAPGADAGTEHTVAQKLQTLFIDDLDGSPADGTVRFALDGTSYEIDLSAEHTQALRGALSRYIDAARREPGTRHPARSRRKPGAGASASTEVRDWARSQGIDVKDRGRIPAELVVKFKAATTQ